MFDSFPMTWSAKSVAVPVFLSLALTLVPVTAAGSSQQADSASTPETKAEKQDRKEEARKARVDEFLLKKKQKREAEEAAKNPHPPQQQPDADDTAVREQTAAEGSAAERIAAGKAAMARDVAEESVTADTSKKKTTKSEAKRQRGGRRSSGSSRGIGQGRGSVSSMQEKIWQSDFAKTPKARSHLELIDSGQASAANFATFGNMLAHKGLVDPALVYYKEALRLAPDNPRIWMNTGTLQQRAGNHASAAKSFAHSIKLDPANALAHYNLGVSLNEMNEYDEAIEEFKLALTIDPELANPETNPQVVNNDLLLPVQLEIFQRNQGTTGITLAPILDVKEKDDTDSGAR